MSMPVSNFRRFRASAFAALVFAFACLVAPMAALAQDTASLEALDAADGPLSVPAGEDVSLAVVRKQNGEPVAGESVDWSIEGADGARLTPDRSVTSNATDAQGAGIARTRFSAREAGRYTVTARNQTNPGCTGEGCAEFVSASFEIDVTGAVAEADSGNRSKWIGGALTALGAVALLASGGDNDNDDDGASGAGQTLTANTGAGQSAMPNQPLPVPLTVRAANDGRDAPGVVVNWSASGGAILNTSSTTTNSFGLAGVIVVSVGPGPGPITVTATRADSGASVTFTANVLIPQLTIVSGNGQSAQTSTTLPLPLVVQALLSGTPQSGIGINWTVTSGDASIQSTSGATNASGQASATVALGPTPGPIVITATRADFPAVSVSFVVNSTVTRTLTLVSGNNQTAAPNGPLNFPLIVRARDNGALAPGITILWSATNGATLSAPTSVTNAGGDASITVTDTGPGPGPFQVTATRADDPSATILFTENIIPPTMTRIAGNAQSGLINTDATTPLEIKLVDGAGVAVFNEVISWQVLSGGAILDSFTTTTDTNGHSTNGFNFGPSPGNITIRASAYGGTEFVDFTATASGPGGGTAGPGDGAVGAPGSTVALTVNVTGPAGVTDLTGIRVDWSVVSGSVTSIAPNPSYTDASGAATTNVTLGLTPGPVVIRAFIQGDGFVDFDLTVSGTLAATTLIVVSGDGQTLATGALSAPMVVELKDGATPLSGMTIRWLTNNGSLTSGTSVTGADGRATNTVTPNAGGAVQVTAIFDAIAQYQSSSTSFTHNATIASVANLDTDEVAMAEALDNACAELQGDGSLTPEEQDLLDQCLALGAAAPVAVAEALTEMLPDVAETQAQTGQTAVNAQFDNLKGRLATLRSGQYGNSFGGLTLVGAGGSVSLFGLMQGLMQDEAPPATEESFSRWGLFASGSIGRGENEPGDNVPSYDYDINGITVGLDYRKTDSVILGAALGFTRQDTDLSGGEGSVEMRGFSVSGYASWYHQDSWYVDGVVTFGRNDFENTRRIVYVLPGEVVDTEAHADFGGSDRSITLTFGRDFQKNAWGSGFYGRVLYSRLGFDEFEEDVDAGNGSGLGLRVESRTVTALGTVLGGKLSYTHSADWGVLIPTAQLEWQKEHKSDPELFRAFLIDDPTGTPILVTGEPLDSSFFRVGVGLSLVLTRGRSGFVLYEKMLARDGMEMDNLSIGFRMEF
jgi:uncharacterized protein with beta-barrel porin domain